MLLHEMPFEGDAYIYVLGGYKLVIMWISVYSEVAYNHWRILLHAYQVVYGIPIKLAI